MALMRLASFEGRVRPGQEAAFRAYVEEKLIPLWRRFDGATEVQVLWAVEADPDPEAVEIPLILAVRYSDRAAMARAMASDARHAAKALLADVFERHFDGVLRHRLMRLDASDG